jgi:glycosyltransferase involved in cell wall biosynthesis
MRENMFLGKNFIISGQLFTSRTETLEDYLLPRVQSLGVIGFVSCFLPNAQGRVTLYEGGRRKKESPLVHFYLSRYAGLKRPLIILAFAVYCLDILFSVVFLRRKFDTCVGIACFSAFIAVLFKKIGIVKRVIYYCLDYYVPEKKPTFNSMFVRTINQIDKFVVRNSDVVWNISQKITEIKQRDHAALSQKSVVVPLGYSSRLKRELPFSSIRRWDIAFVGTITFNQGLQLLLEGMPEIARKFPQVKAHIIGKGPYFNDFVSQVKQRQLNQYFEFYGFIKEEERVLDILARSALGLAVWDDSLENENVKFADPGKLKLYALCGIPMITTAVAPIADDIIRRKIGMVIEYTPAALIDAVAYLLSDNGRIEAYRRNAAAFGWECTSEYVFDRAFKESEDIVKKCQ